MIDLVCVRGQKGESSGVGCGVMMRKASRSDRGIYLFKVLLLTQT